MENSTFNVTETTKYKAIPLIILWHIMYRIVSQNELIILDWVSIRIFIVANNYDDEVN